MQLLRRILGKAPEFEGVEWLNTKPLTMKELDGKVVMIDFWTYSCVNCIRTLPHMKKMHEKYSKKGLVIIGIHTPEFDFEKKIENVQKAVKKHKLLYPIAVDSKRTMWLSYANSYWPRQYLIDAHGKIRWDHIGEGGEEEIEAWIIKLLQEAGAKLGKVKLEKEEEKEHQFGTTQETYIGKERNKGIGSVEVCLPGGKCGFLDNKKEHELGVVYLNGAWEQEAEFAVHDEDKEGYILLPYLAREVNIVLGGEKLEVEVLLDGKPIPKDKAGPDVKTGKKKSTITVEGHDMYRIVKTKKLEEHEVKLVVKKKGLKAYAYTFG